MSEKKTNEQFLEDFKLKNKYYDDIEVMDKYINAITKMECRCKIHKDYIWFTIADNLLSGRGCKLCGFDRAGKIKSKTHEQFMEEFELKDNFNDVEVIGKYTGANKHIKCRCKIHDYVWNPTPTRLLLGQGCKYCKHTKQSKNIRSTKENYSKKFDVISNGEYELVSEYEKSDTDVLIKHLKCGLIFNQKAGIFLQGIGCPYCFGSRIEIGIHDMWTTNPKLAKLLLNPEDGYKYRQCSEKLVDWKCPNCENIIENKMINVVKGYGLACPICSDGISYPQKLMGNVLKELNVNFKTEQKFDWCKFKLNDEDKFGLYDFVFKLNNQKYIIETDGRLGHGKKVHQKSKLTNEDCVYIDGIKDKLALENGYNIFRINCEESDLNYIKNNILSSKLNDLFDLYNIDWNKCHENSLKSKVIEACDLWNNGTPVKQIGKILKLTSDTIVIYLKRCTEIGLCNYIVVRRKKDIKKDVKIPIITKKKVMCINTNKYFDSITEASLYYSVDHRSIGKTCDGKRKSAGKHPITKEPLLWAYYENYSNMTENDITLALENSNRGNMKKVKCKTTNQIFDSVVKAAKFFNINERQISECANKKRSYGGIDKTTKEKLIWEFIK